MYVYVCVCMCTYVYVCVRMCTCVRSCVQDVSKCSPCLCCVVSAGPCLTCVSYYGQLSVPVVCVGREGEGSCAVVRQQISAGYAPGCQHPQLLTQWLCLPVLCSLLLSTCTLCKHADQCGVGQC